MGDFDNQISSLRERVRNLRKVASLLAAEIDSIESYMDTLRRYDDDAVRRMKAELKKAEKEKPKDGGDVTPGQ